jgi:hypothetical protein
MAPRRTTHPVSLEVGGKRVFAGAIDWPGWCRSGRDEDGAIEALFAYAPRYAHVLRGTRLGFETPDDASALTVVERLTGTATTDFGAPDVPPSADEKPAIDEDLARFTTLLRACWRAFDRAAERAQGKEVAKGPRGGGRDLDGIIDHVLGADEGYLALLGAKAPKGGQDEHAARVRKGCARCARHRRARRRAARPTRREAMEPAVLRPAFVLARPRPCVGARGPDARSMRSDRIVMAGRNTSPNETNGPGPIWPGPFGNHRPRALPPITRLRPVDQPEHRELGELVGFCRSPGGRAGPRTPPARDGSAASHLGGLLPFMQAGPPPLSHVAMVRHDPRFGNSVPKGNPRGRWSVLDRRDG